MNDDQEPLRANKESRVIRMPVEDLEDVFGDLMGVSPEAAQARRVRREAVERDRQAAYARVLLFHYVALKRHAVGPLAHKMLTLHAPVLVEGEPDAVCTGCDPGDPESYYPEWPCRTYVLVARYVGAQLDGQGRPLLDG